MESTGAASETSKPARTPLNPEGHERSPEGHADPYLIGTERHLRADIHSRFLLCYSKQVLEWHKKMEETRIQELRKGRELTAQKEENQYLKNLVEEQERAICRLEDQVVQQNMVRRVCTSTVVEAVTVSIPRSNTRVYPQSFRTGCSWPGSSVSWSWSASWTSRRMKTEAGLRW